jgi:hypothetical protein
MFFEEEKAAIKQNKNYKTCSNSHCLGTSHYVNFLGGLGSNEFHIK